MTAWTNDELENIGAADELQLASRRADGTLRKPVTIWVVRRSEDLYVRAFKGRTSPWFRATQARGEGQIKAGGMQKDVAFVEPDRLNGDALDAEYRSKYGRYGARYVDPMVSAEARAATIKLIPRT
jgi:hypothetical protein